MGKELAALYPVAKETFEEADDALGYKLSQLCFEGPEDQLKLTEITQPAILTVSVAAWRVLQSKAITPPMSRATAWESIRRTSRRARYRSPTPCVPFATVANTCRRRCQSV